MNDDVRAAGDQLANSGRAGDERLDELSAGNHVAEIVRVSRGEAENGPHIDLTVRTASGELSDRIAYRTANGSRRILALTHAAGIPIPTAEDLEADGRLTEQFAGSLNGKSIGIVVRAGKDGVRIAGYVWPGHLWVR